MAAQVDCQVSSPRPALRGQWMDLNSFHQLIAGISLAFAAGLTHRPVQQAPIFHIPACEVGPPCPSEAGWSTEALALAAVVAYLVGSVLPASTLQRVVSRLLRRYAGPPAASTSSASPSTTSRRRSASAPRALFED